MASDELDTALRQQIAYYRARASEYDQWFLRQGRYDWGEELNRQWFDEAREVQRALKAFGARGRVLELACGTGLWTQHLAETADAISAVDSSPEVLALNRDRLHDSRIEYIEADLFAWQPTAQYDVVFFGFWLSHVPPERFDAFWRMLRMWLVPGGRVFFVDSRYDATSTAHDHALGAADAARQVRRLNDGHEFSIIKVFYEPEQLEARLAALGWDVSAAVTKRYLLYGSGSPVLEDD